MNKIRALILVAFLASGAQAALRTSAQDGNWGTSATWQGGNIPGSGDTVSIYHVVSATDTRVVGTSPAEGNVVVNLFSTGTLRIMSGSSVTVNGDITYTAGAGNTTDAVNVTAGGTLNIKNYSFYPSTNFGYRQFKVVGVSSAPAVLVGNAGSNASLKAGGFAYVGGYTFTYALLRNLAFSFYYRDDSGSPDNTQWQVTYSTFTGCGVIDNNGGLQKDMVFRHENNTHVNTVGGKIFDMIINQGKSTTGIRVISSNTFDTSLGDNLGLKDFTVRGNYFGDKFQALYSTGTYSHNFIRMTDDNMSIGGQITTSYFLLDIDADNPHVINTLSKSSTFDGVIFGQSGISKNTNGTGDSGEWFIPGAEADIATFTVIRSIFLPNATGYSSGEIASMLGSGGQPESWTNYFMDVRHNTWFGGWGTGLPFAAMQISETANMSPEHLIFKSNLSWNPQDTGKRANFTKVFDIGNYTSDLTAGYSVGPTTNVCTASNCNYNASYGLSHTSYTAANTGKYQNQQKGYVANFTAAPGANDVDGTNPAFIDYKRNAELFDSDFYRPYMGLSQPAIWYSTNTYAVGDYVKHSSSTYYWGETINFRYVNNAGCSAANPEPGVQILANWSSCWEFATYQAIRDSIVSNQTFTDSTIGASGADVIETLTRWVRYGYTPTAAAYDNAAHDGGDIGAVSALVGIAGRPSISPSTATVQTTKTIQFTSTNTVAWSMVPGSLGSIDANGLYTAPSTIQNRVVGYGCPLIPDDHIYATDITSLPVISQSAARVANVGAVNHDFEISFPPNLMTNATAVASTMTFRYTTTQNGATYYFLADPYRASETNLRPNDYFAQDRHILAVNSDTCEIQEVYNFYPRGTNQAECVNCNAQSGVKYGPMSYQLAAYDGSTDAAGLYILPLAIKYDELKAGAINHALRFTLSNGYNHSSFLWPGTNYSAQCSALATCFPYGSRLRLKQSFSESGLSTKARTIVQAMKKYGMFMADGGLTGNLQVMTDVASDTETWHVLMNEIPGSNLDFTDFEQVDESSLMISSDTGKVRVPNPYNVVPNNYAIVVATNTVDGSTSTVYIAIQGVNAGVRNTPYPADHGVISAMAGTPQFALPYTITGSTQTTATCTMSPTLGTLSSDCLYTAPSSVVKFSSTVVTVTPVADSTSPITFPLVVYSSDAIRVDTGWQATAQVSSPAIPYDAQGNYGPDVNGNYWAGRMPGSLMNWYSRNDVSFPQASWRQPQPSDIGLHYSEMHGTSDGYFGAIVPNGTYVLKLLFGTDDSNLAQNNVMQIESQNQILMSSSSYVTFIGTSAYTAKTSTHSITVADNNFYFALRFPDNDNKFTLLNGFSLELQEAAQPPVAQRRKTISGRSRIKGRGVFR